MLPLSKKIKCHTHYCHQSDKFKNSRISVLPPATYYVILIYISNRSYKVVKPEWITKSIESQQLLPWQQYQLLSAGQILNKNILSNQWSRATSTANPEFIKRYYETSRLHYLSIWKAELKEIVEKLQEKYPTKIAIPHGPRVIM